MIAQLNATSLAIQRGSTLPLIPPFPSVSGLEAGALHEHDYAAARSPAKSGVVEQRSPSVSELKHAQSLSNTTYPILQLSAVGGPAVTHIVANQWPGDQITPLST